MYPEAKDKLRARHGKREMMNDIQEDQNEDEDDEDDEEGVDFDTYSK